MLELLGFSVWLIQIYSLYIMWPDPMPIYLEINPNKVGNMFPAKWALTALLAT